jgi:hypothetical protein
MHFTFDPADEFSVENRRFVRDRSGKEKHLSIFGNAVINGTLDLTANTAAGFSTNGYAQASNWILGSLKSATFMMRVKPSALTSQPRLFDFGSASGNSIFLRGSAFTAGYKYNGGTTTLINSGTALTVGQEALVAMTYDARSKTTRIFLNGTQTASATTIAYEPWQLTEIAPDTRNYIGRAQWWDSSVAADNIDFRGTIDDFMVFDTALTPAEMEQMLNNITSSASPFKPAMSIHPNPVKSGNTLYISSVIPVSEIELINTLGQSIARYQNIQSQFTLPPSQKAGIYFLRILSQDGQNTHRLVIE